MLFRLAPVLFLALSGCSVAALVQTDNLDKRVQTLETRVHDLEMKQQVAVQDTKPDQSKP